MTTEKAIRRIKDHIAVHHIGEYPHVKLLDAMCMAISALRAQQQAQKNDPLTLEEMWEMDGEPVWVVGISSINNFNGHWDICSLESGDATTFPYCGENPDINLYGITWKAYRHKPEEADHGQA